MEVVRGIIGTGEELKTTKCSQRNNRDRGRIKDNKVEVVRGIIGTGEELKTTKWR